MTRKIHILNTGGTIGMRRTENGYAPEPGFLGEQIAEMPELSHPSMPELVLDELDELLDSANMMPSDWSRIARDVADRYDDYDGFVVIHGTDTMAYTASALSFLLEGLAKPVILTGSQVPLCEVRSDARTNLITSLLIASSFRIPEVCLFFGDRLFRGNRAVKVSADGFDAFDSPNYPPLGTVGVDIDVNWNRVRMSQRSRLTLHEIGSPYVGALRLFPGISAELVQNALQPPLQGLVLEAYGVGNAPERNTAFLNALEEACSRGVVIVNCTQCLSGTVDLSGYATGSALARAGVISGYDMTAEAALTKLAFLFSQGLEPVAAKEQMQQNLRGEMTR
jgi:L-asparaginase